MKNAIEDNCPSQEDLSEYYDMLRSGKLLAPLFVRLNGHVQACDTCRKTIEAYRILDRLIAEELQPPLDFPEKIKAHCHEQAEKDARKAIAFHGFWHSAAARAAALFAALGLCYALWNANQNSSPNTRVTEWASSKHAHARTVADPQNPHTQSGTQPAQAPLAENNTKTTYNENTSQQEISRSADTTDHSINTSAVKQGTLKLRELQNVSLTAPKRKRRASDALAREMPDAVRHIWMVDDVEQSSDAIRQLAEKNGARMTHAFGEGATRVLTLQGFSDIQLQALVQTLNEQNWALVSPMLPQPDQEDKVAFKGKDVIYTLRLVKKDP